MSIKRKLMLTMMGINLAAIALTVTAITAYLIYDMRRSKIEELAVTADITGDRNAAALVFLDPERARRNLDIFQGSPSILVVCIYDAKNALFARYRSDTAALDCPADPARAPASRPDMLAAIGDVKHNSDTVGKVYMASDTRDIDAYVRRIMAISGSAAVLVLGVTVLLTVYFQRSISGPILELAATARAITGSRDYTLEARCDYDGETQILARAFNTMIGEVRDRDHELVQANQTLEQKINERTRQLEVAKCRAEAASEAKSEFLRNMSHEFRTPLHAILNFASFGLKEYDKTSPEQLRQYFEFIHKGSERLARLVNEVLDLAKLECGEQQVTMRHGNLHELAARAAEGVRPLLDEKQLHLHLDGADLRVEALCDHDKIIQVITNLLANAIKFTPPGKRITVQTCWEGQDGERQAVVRVIDEGIGIPEGETEVIFESFRQSSRTNTGAGGTGLGLAICRGLIGLHGGRIWAENNADAPGARVTFFIPAVQEKQESLPAQTTEGHHGHAA